MASPKVTWTRETAENRLWEAGVEVDTVEEMASGHGAVIRTRDGRLVNVYNTGSLVCQGKLIAETRLLFGAPPERSAVKIAQAASPLPAREATRTELVDRDGHSIRITDYDGKTPEPTPPWL